MRTTTARTLAAVSGLALLLAACDAAEEAIDDTDDAVAEETAADDGEYSVDDQPDDAAASFVSPADGETISGPVTVELAADGVDIVEAGAPEVGEAHFHVLVDQGCFDTGETIPGPSDEDMEEGRYHYGDGSDGGEIDLEPGEYELCAQLGDGTHVAFGDTDTITITVE